MTLRFYGVVVDSVDIAALSRWWLQVLDWQLEYEDDDEVTIVPRWATEDDDRPRDQRMPGLVFVAVRERKTAKNRLHIDLAPAPDDDQGALVRRLVDLGATHVDIGQGDRSWVVLADPEGNEFCVLSARE
jgi:hypothetical protein